MCAISLKHAGFDVTVIEREGNFRESHMAGVGFGLDMVSFLHRHDRISSPFTLRILHMQSVPTNLNVQVFVNWRRDITSWDAYYFRLRSLFDGFASSYYPSSPVASETDGAALFLPRKDVVDIWRNDDDCDGDSGARPLIVKVRDRDTQEVVEIQADVVIGADGPSSVVRSKYLPDYGRKTVGYVTWRGVIPERDVSEATRELLKRSSNVHMAPRQHCIAYLIPGENGSLEPGERHFNFAWYTNETPESLSELLLDAVDGHRHRYTVPAGRIREHIWKAKIEDARSAPFPEPFLELVTKIEKPFVQAITETDVPPRAALEDGRVLLVGDALCQYRPHTALSATQAAFDSLLVAEHLRGAISLAEWEEKVLRFAHLHSSQSRYWGRFYQEGTMPALVSACRYWWHCWVDRIKSWWRGEVPLLRTAKFRRLNEHDN
jgi:2-polyprenyl-6-methoxyphenol hydroxylase-like FAD-dependent oxidoreductase